MANINKSYDEVRIPFNKMSFTPDVPSTQLSPNEYNSGANVETDVRGIRSMAGDQKILDSVPGTPTFITGGFRYDDKFWFIVATTEGYWYASNGGAWENITTGGIAIPGYTQATNITEAWSGSVPFFNDAINPPVFLPDNAGATLVRYSNLQPLDIADIAYLDPTTQRITLSTAQTAAPYIAGDQIVISGVDNYYDGLFTVAAATITTIDYLAVPGAAYSYGGSVAPAYSWNYNPNWKSVSANFMRMFNTPNVGSILIAGNLTTTDLVDSVENYPVTVQWSQAFGLNQAPLTWQPTIVNVANQLEVPLRGPALDGFPCNGNFFLCSYWDTVVFSPINYSTTSAPILGVRLLNQGRGLLSANCWANTDKLVYGVDARDIWVFDGQDFQGLGNQRVKNWFYDQLDPLYVDRVFMEVNSQRNQVELYYPTVDAINGVPNKMLSYRYDLDVWNAPRDVSSATMSTESPIYHYSTGFTSGTYTECPTLPISSTGSGAKFNVTVADDSTVAVTHAGPAFIGTGYAATDTIYIDGTYVGNTIPGGRITITVQSVDIDGGIMGFTWELTPGEWNGNYGSRTVVYARGVLDESIVQKDQGYSFIDDQPINSVFRRDNIKMLADYSGKLLVHRILPEVVNIADSELPINTVTQPELIGSISVKIEGANSVGQAPLSTVHITMPTNTNDPWTQINQNAHRVNTIELSNSSTTNMWMCSATTWQYTQTEDDR